VGNVWYDGCVAIPIFIAALLAALAGAAYVTNPFSRLSIIRRPFVVELTLGSLKAIDNNHKLVLRQRLWWRVFAVQKAVL